MLATASRPHAWDSHRTDPAHASLPERCDAAEPIMPTSPASAGHTEAAEEAICNPLPGTHAVGWSITHTEIFFCGAVLLGGGADKDFCVT